MALRLGASNESGTNLARVKDYNEVVVLDLIRGRGPIGRPAIAASTGLTLQTVSNITRRLLNAGVVMEEPVATAGRTRRALRVKADGGFALGIHLVRSSLAVGVVDLAGTIRGCVETAIAVDESLVDVVERLGDLVGESVEQAGISYDQLLGAGIGAPGPLDLRRGVLLNVIRRPSWSRFPIREAVADALGMTVILDNDSMAAALGEQWAGGRADADSLVYLYLGTGFGCGLVLHGQAYRGTRGNAGEVGHIQVEPNGPPCECGSRGCVGLYVTPQGLLREARRVALEAPATQPLPAAPETVEELVSSEEARFADVVALAGERLGRVVTHLTRTLDPELIVLGGPLISLIGESFRAAITRCLRDLDESGAPPPHVEISRIGSDAGVIGAATLILHDLYAPTAHKLSLAEPPGGRPARRRAA